MSSLLIGNSMIPTASTLDGGTAYYFEKSALYDGDVSEIRLDLSAPGGVTKVAIYADTGPRLWWTSDTISSSGDDYLISVSPVLSVTKDDRYCLFINTTNGSVKSTSLGLDYGVYYVARDPSTNDPPANLFDLSWLSDPCNDYAMRAKGTLDSNPANILLGAPF